MRQIRSSPIVLIVAFALAAMACGPKGTTPSEKREFVRKMRSDTLNKLFQIRPAARANVQRSVGYAVFSNVESKIMLVGAGSGYGVLVDNATGKETFSAWRASMEAWGGEWSIFGPSSSSTTGR